MPAAELVYALTGHEIVWGAANDSSTPAPTLMHAKESTTAHQHPEAVTPEITDTQGTMPCHEGNAVGIPRELTELTDVREILDALAQAGWSPERIRTHAWAVWEAGEPWPHPIALEALRRIGPARWHALVGATQSALGLDVSPQKPTNRTSLTADERRLLQDVPPHHGNVG